MKKFISVILLVVLVATMGLAFADTNLSDAEKAQYCFEQFSMTLSNPYNAELKDYHVYAQVDGNDLILFTLTAGDKAISCLGIYNAQLGKATVLQFDCVINSPDIISQYNEVFVMALELAHHNTSAMYYQINQLNLGDTEIGRYVEEFFFYFTGESIDWEKYK